MSKETTTASNQKPSKLKRKDGVRIRSKINAEGKKVLSSGAPDMRENPAIKEKLRAALVAGNTYEASCRLANIALSTFTRWMKQGRESKEGTLAREFFDHVELATAEAEHRNVMAIQKAATRGNWQAAAWWLERRRPKHYARRDVVTLSEDELPVDSSDVDGALSEKERDAALSALLRRKPSLIPKQPKKK
jgi:hypothetical protein